MVKYLHYYNAKPFLCKFNLYIKPSLQNVNVGCVHVSIPSSEHNNFAEHYCSATRKLFSGNLLNSLK